MSRKFPPACTCPRCVACCDRPGWPTPAEAKRLIHMGLGGRLMLDYWAEDSDLPYTEVLSPAVKGNEGRGAPFWPSGGCTFLKEGLCEIHDSGAKPYECRAAHHSREDADVEVCSDHLRVARMWATPKGRAIVEAWQQALPA